MRGAWNLRRPSADGLLLTGMLTVLAVTVLGGIFLLVVELSELLSARPFSRGDGG